MNKKGYEWVEIIAAIAIVLMIIFLYFWFFPQKINAGVRTLDDLNPADQACMAVGSVNGLKPIAMENDFDEDFLPNSCDMCPFVSSIDTITTKAGDVVYLSRDSDSDRLPDGCDIKPKEKARKQKDYEEQCGDPTKAGKDYWETNAGKEGQCWVGREGYEEYLQHIKT